MFQACLAASLLSSELFKISLVSLRIEQVLFKRQPEVPSAAYDDAGPMGMERSERERGVMSILDGDKCICALRNKWRRRIYCSSTIES